MAGRLAPCPCCANNISTGARQCPRCGERNPFAVAGLLGAVLTESEKVQIRSLREESFMEAVKFLRQITDCGLHEAKVYVDSLG